jgi:DNA repair exonuclease SbcCD ATPase subunit
MSFDNTFIYGEGNIIDFDTLHGITGIFGKNRSGKSSIPGTLVYGLFNSTDRGTLKNLHVVNNRKTYCRATVDISIGGEWYRIDRQTVKRTNRNGVISAPTSLNLFRIDSTGDVITDSTEEQRRETEKILREIVGTIDDFLMTSFASQGDMNAFIREGATKRKAILTRFLDLEIFDEMLKIAKNQMVELRGEMKLTPDRDWGTLIHEKESLISNLTSEREEIELELKELKDKRDQLKIQLSALPSESRYTQSEINEQVNHLQGLEKKKTILANEILGTSGEMQSIGKKIEKIAIIREQFPVEELRDEAETQAALIRQVDALEADLSLQLQRLESKTKLAKKLDRVPCGDQFPKCPYIKDAHKSSSELAGQKESVSSVRKELRAVRNNLEKLIDKGLEEKLQRYGQILEQEQEFKLNNSEMKLRLREQEALHQTVMSELEQGKDSLRDMRLRSIDEEKDSEIVKMRMGLRTLEKRISEIDAERLYLTEQISVSRQDRTTLSTEKEKFGAVRERWETYSLFTQAVDKKGIPLTILSLQLPQINAELTKILQGVVNFDLELVADPESNNMDILVDYGDSKRIIESGSGMEKMISSLALRVALINVCNAPRSDILIIDEGFGALDDKNIEACSRLLISLKKYFSNILIISHVDAVKDIVDNVLDIQKVGKDARICHA